MILIVLNRGVVFIYDTPPLCETGTVFDINTDNRYQNPIPSLRATCGQTPQLGGGGGVGKCSRWRGREEGGEGKIRGLLLI